MTREADDLDEAGKLTQQLNDAYVQNARDLARPEQVQNKDGSWPRTDCVDCEEGILPQRLALGKIRCVLCQQDLEKLRGTSR